MRSSAIILAFTVFFLALKPGVDQLFSHCEDEITCCSSDGCSPFALGEDVPEDQNNDCDGNSCNPFQSCSSSFTLANNTIDASVHAPTTPASRNFTYKFNVHSNLATDFWQPPQLTV